MKDGIIMKIVTISAADAKVIAALLEKANDDAFSNSSCNDFNLSKIITQKEIDDLNLRCHKSSEDFKYGDPVIQDNAIASYYSKMLKKLAGGG